MKIIILSLLVLNTVSIAQADTLRIKKLHITPPISAPTPLRTDKTDVMGKAWDNNSTLLNSVRDLNQWQKIALTSDSILSAPVHDAVRLAGFTLENRDYAKINIYVKGVDKHEISIDGQKTTNTSLTPGRHEVSIKILQKAGKSDTLNVSLESKQYVVINPNTKAPYELKTLMYGERLGSVSLSADGRFMTLSKNTTTKDNNTHREIQLIDLRTGKRQFITDFLQWTSTGHRFITTHKKADGSVCYRATDALTHESQDLFVNRTGESGYLLPGEQLMLINKKTQGPGKEKGVYQIIEPDDRIPNWRDRNNIMLLDTRNGQLRSITEGQHNVYAQPSPDQKTLLLSITQNKITERPFSFQTALLLNLETMIVDTLFTHEGFVSYGQWAPDAKSIVFQGSPEAFGGIGKRLPEGMIPNMIEQELYRIDLDSRKITPLTAELNPSIDSWKWSKADGMIYALCENHDNKDIFRIDPRTGKAKQLQLSERFIMRFNLADNARVLTYVGQGHSNSDRAYTVNLSNDKETLIEDLNATRMADIELGKFAEWNFKSERGDTIYGTYYLPPHFDENKQYPMLVYYYGGCSPVGRYLDSYYSFHGWAAMGYVVYVIQPSGCTGFGQEFAARHVNAYGNYTAEDIIQGTKLFIQEHPFVNKDKVGCLGASYGGFMTQYLQTQTDIFAAAVSHAGISDPSSYWGYGYWGYSYSAISAANSYPWNNPELYNSHAPLKLADRIHTPLLFMHGTDDTNVPINESIQMFNALKILGRETAFVAVEGQNHHILDYPKRILWQNTIYAWFQKWLKDDPTWWEDMYPTKKIQ